MSSTHIYETSKLSGVAMVLFQKSFGKSFEDDGRRRPKKFNIAWIHVSWLADNKLANRVFAVKLIALTQHISRKIRH